jgi:hypothetical protein
MVSSRIGVSIWLTTAPTMFSKNIILMLYAGFSTAIASSKLLRAPLLCRRCPTIALTSLQDLDGLTSPVRKHLHCTRHYLYLHRSEANNFSIRVKLESSASAHHQQEPFEMGPMALREGMVPAGGIEPTA